MHTTILSWDGEALLGSYVRAKITIGYDRDIPCLYMVYAINAQQWIYSAKIVMNLQSCVRTCMYISLPGRGTSYHPSQNEDIHLVGTWISNMTQAAQTGAWFGVVDCSFDKLNLVYKSIYHDVTGI